MKRSILAAAAKQSEKAQSGEQRAGWLGDRRCVINGDVVNIEGVTIRLGVAVRLCSAGGIDADAGYIPCADSADLDFDGEPSINSRRAIGRRN